MSVGFAAGLRALLSAKTVMDVIGHNLANQNTPGYSRQVPILQTTNPVIGANLAALGTGVQVSNIRAAVNESLLTRIRSEVASVGRYGTESSILSQIESLFGDLTENGLAKKLQTVFDEASEAATAPEDLVRRQNFVSASSDLALAFRLRNSGLVELRNTSLLEAQTIVTTANQLTEVVASLNVKIRTQEAVGGTANDLRDLRTVAMETLAELIGATGFPLEDGTVNVSVNGTTLVSGATAAKLQASISFDGGISLTAGDGGLEVKANSGRLGGILNTIAEYVPDRLADLDRMAKNLILEMNQIHAKGVPLNGPYQQAVGSFPITVPNGIDPLSVALEDAGLPFEISNGTLSIAVTELSTGDVVRHDIQISPTNQSVQDLLDSISAIPELSAFVDGAGKFHIKSIAGYGFDFSKRLDALPVEGGTFGAGNATLVGDGNFPAALLNGATLSIAVDGGAAQTVTFNAADFADIANATADEVAAVLNAQVTGIAASVVDGKLVVASQTAGATSTLAVTDGALAPNAALQLAASAAGTDTPATVTVTGAGTGTEPHAYTFKPSGDGVIGVTPGLEIDVYDENNTLVTSLPIGDGYEPGDPLEVVEGVFVSFGPGAVQGTAGQFFTLEVPADTDTSGILGALGINALFEGTDSATIDVNALLEKNPELLAGALTGGPGDGGNFLELAAVAEKPLDGLNDASISSFYNKFAAEVGTTAAGAASALDSSSLILLTLESQRGAESGVNPDEELLMLERFQDAYEAAAKYLAVLTELDDALLQL